MAALAQPPRMSSDEKGLARRLHFDQGKSPADIARMLQRAASTVGRLLAQKKAPKPVGRPKALSEKKIDNLVALLEKMVDDADATHEVSMDMLIRRGACDGVQACSG